MDPSIGHDSEQYGPAPQLMIEIDRRRQAEMKETGGRYKWERKLLRKK